MQPRQSFYCSFIQEEPKSHELAYVFISVQCASDSECGVAGHCYLGNELCGCLTTNCSGVAFEAMPNCGWYCQCEDATNQWRLKQCSPGTLFDEEKYTCNHGYTVEQTVCATGIFPKQNKPALILCFL